MTQWEGFVFLSGDPSEYLGYACAQDTGLAEAGGG